MSHKTIYEEAAAKIIAHYDDAVASIHPDAKNYDELFEEFADEMKLELAKLDADYELLRPDHD